MKVTKLGSATVLINSNGTNILCDPWLIDGAYYGSWCNFPPIKIKEIDFKAIDYVYVSHIHPDHFDFKTINYIDKNIPFLIHSYHKKFLKSNIERLGYKVIELENGSEFKLNEKTSIEIYAADNCDPNVCGRLFGCITSDIKGSVQLDSLCVISDGNTTIVNTNDCPYEIAKQALNDVKKKYSKIDFLLVGYTSASLYPHCMMSYSEEKMKKGIDKAKKRGLDSGLKIINCLQPKYYMPFAGTYIIGGPYFKKNLFLPLPEIQDAIKYFDSSGLLPQSEAILLNLNEFFDIKLKEISKKYIPIDIEEKKKYINQIASKFEYPFLKKDLPDNQYLVSLFEKSLFKLKAKQKEIDLFEDLNLIFDLNQNKFININLKNTSISIISDFSNLKNYHRFKLDSRLLELVLKGPKYANWNNIEIGALLEFDRKPDIFRQEIHILMNSLHL